MRAPPTTTRVARRGAARGATVASVKQCFAEVGLMAVTANRNGWMSKKGDNTHKYKRTNWCASVTGASLQTACDSDMHTESAPRLS